MNSHESSPVRVCVPTLHRRSTRAGAGSGGGRSFTIHPDNDKLNNNITQIFDAYPRATSNEEKGAKDDLDTATQPCRQQEHDVDRYNQHTHNSFLGNESMEMSQQELSNSDNYNDNNSQQQPAVSVLNPIRTSDVKKRTYLIGSVCQDSLLGHDELYRYFPSSQVTIFACTWNQNRKRAPLNLNDLLLPEKVTCMADIYVIGIQEAFSSCNEYVREWEVELQTTLGPSHVLLHSVGLGVLHLAIFVRRDLIWFCSMPEDTSYNSRTSATNLIKTKGAVSICFRFFGTSFLFVNCHLPAHENKLKDRIDEYERIKNSIQLPKDLKSLKPRYLSQDSTARFDCVFFMGDLNFRLQSRTFDEVLELLTEVVQQPDPSYECLLQHDELCKVIETGQAFYGFSECQIKFPPTYKFMAHTNKYDRQLKRVPSYTDRILYRSKRPRHIKCLYYDWLPQMLSSDHKPVYCLFQVLIRPGHDNIALNAGLFQRSVYLEALKRRAEEPSEMGQDDLEARDSMICSLC